MSSTLTAKWISQDDPRPVRSYSLIHHTAIAFFFHAPFSRSAEVQQLCDWPEPTEPDGSPGYGQEITYVWLCKQTEADL